MKITQIYLALSATLFLLTPWSLSLASDLQLIQNSRHEKSDPLQLKHQYLFYYSKDFRRQYLRNNVDEVRDFFSWDDPLVNDLFPVTPFAFTDFRRCALDAEDIIWLWNRKVSNQETRAYYIGFNFFQLANTPPEVFRFYIDDTRNYITSIGRSERDLHSWLGLDFLLHPNIPDDVILEIFKNTKDQMVVDVLKANRKISLQEPALGDVQVACEKERQRILNNPPH